MSALLKKINKYIILMIVSSIFGMPWFYVRHLLFDINNRETYALIDSIPGYVDYLIRLITIVFLIIDFRREHLKYLVLACIAALFFPLLGIIMFSLLYLEKGRDKVSA
jgi:hypothetical protein